MDWVNYTTGWRKREVKMGGNSRNLWGILFDN